MSSSEIHTFSPVAKTEIFQLHHIGEKITPSMEKLVQETRQEKIRLMREVFNSLTGKKLQIIEADQNAKNASNVILRDKNGSGIARLGHGTEIQAVSIPGLKKPGVNDNGYHFEEMTDNKGRKRIYVEVQTNSGKRGYVAMEHIGSIGQAPDKEEKRPETQQQKAQPTETDTGDKKDQPQQKAQPTETDKEEKRPETQQQKAQPTETDKEEKRPETQQQKAQPTETDTGDKKDQPQQKAQPTETPKDADIEIARNLLQGAMINEALRSVLTDPSGIKEVQDFIAKNGQDKLVAKPSPGGSGIRLEECLFYPNGFIGIPGLGNTEIQDIKLDNERLVVVGKDGTSIIFVPQK